MANRFEQYNDDAPPPPPEGRTPSGAVITVRPLGVEAPANRFEQYSDLPPPSTEQFGPPVPPRTWWDTTKKSLQAIGQTADDLIRATGNAITFGGADRLEGLLNLGAAKLGADGPQTYDQAVNEQVKLSEEARKRSPYASIAGDVGGAALLPGIGGKALAARAAPHLPGWLARGLGYGAEGAVLGAAQGAGNTYTGNALDYFRNAGTGGMMGGILGAGIGGAFGPRGGMRSSAPATTLEDVGRAKGIAYDTLEANSAGFNRDFLAGEANRLDAGPLYPFYNKADIPTTQAALERMRNLPRQFVAPAEIESIRKGINTIPDLRPTDIAAGRHVKEALDNFYTNPPAGAIRPGTEPQAALAAQQAKTARDLAAAEFRMQKMADMRTAAENQAATTYSGLNVENNIRNQIKNFINPNTGGRGRLAGYTAEEEAALNNIVHRGTIANVGRWAGNVMAGGGGVAVPIAAAFGGSALGQFAKDNPWLSTTGAIGVPAAGLLLRSLSNRSARNTIRNAEELIGQRNPLYQARAAVAPMVPPPGGGVPKGIRDAITLEILRQQEAPP